jgi:nitrate/TMAO reductase-like tetraheme cytochrome c subunit
MTMKQPSGRSKSRRLVWVLASVVALGVVLAAGGFVFAANQESHDPFCGSCHTQRESTFLQRSTAAQPVDLASYHTSQQTRCIDCHSGPGIVGRIEAELLGAHNAISLYTHTAVQPARLTVPIRDANCLKCHQAVTQRGYTPQIAVSIPGLGGQGEREARTNHWHENLARWQIASSTAGTCTSCHPGHLTDGTAQTGFENGQTTNAVCQACHRVLREGEFGG